MSSKSVVGVKILSVLSFGRVLGKRKGIVWRRDWSTRSERL